MAGHKRKRLRPSPAFPVLARGVSVYTLWNHTPDIPDTFYRPPLDSVRNEEKIGSWYTIQLIWKPPGPDGDDETPWIDASEPSQAFPVLIDYLDKLAAIQPADHTGANGQARPLFYLLHVRELNVLVPHFYRLRYRRSKEMQQKEVLTTRRGFVTELQGQYDLLNDAMQYTSLADAFDHYDRDQHGRGSRGWIVISPSRALLVGVSDKAVRIFISLIQRRDLDVQGHGIYLDRYDDVLGRLSNWNSIQEIRETMDQLEDMVSNGNKAISGQVLLALILALMGVVFAIYSVLQPDNWQRQSGISLGILFIAALFSWFYARFGARLWFILGVLAIVATALFDTAVFWLGPLMRLLSFLHI